jgi:hypothetical protein
MRNTLDSSGIRNPSLRVLLLNRIETLSHHRTDQRRGSSLPHSLHARKTLILSSGAPKKSGFR